MKYSQGEMLPLETKQSGGKLFPHSFVKSTMFHHRNIHKYIWTSPDGNTHNQIDYILIDGRRQSSILDVRSFRGADCDSDHYMVVAKLRERLAVNKKAAQKFDGERFNLRKLNELEVKEQYQNSH